MEIETIKAHVNLDDYSSKMKPEDSATITMMCLDRLTAKAEELKELYTQLVKTYGIEMGICGITCIVQISSSVLPMTPVLGLLGTADDIKDGLTKLTVKTLQHLAEMNKEEGHDDKE